MSKSFLANNPTEEWIKINFGGFDPDLHNSALAIIQINISQTNEAKNLRKRIYDYHILTINVHDRLKGLEACDAMIYNVQQTIRSPKFFELAGIIIESQQVYYKDNDSRAKIVGMANDLLMLATITGAAAAAMYAKGAEIRIQLPAQWKGQRKKENMHRRAREIIQDSKDVPRVKRNEMDNWNIHEMDALCMALKAGGFNV